MVVCLACAGVMGCSGDAGRTGEAGPAGPRGPAGRDGPEGPAGERGAQGAPGVGAPSAAPSAAPECPPGTAPIGAGVCVETAGTSSADPSVEPLAGSASDQASALCTLKGRRLCDTAEARRAFLCYGHDAGHWCPPGAPSGVSLGPIRCWATADVVATAAGIEPLYASRLDGTRLVFETETDIEALVDCPEYRCCHDL